MARQNSSGQIEIYYIAQDIFVPITLEYVNALEHYASQTGQLFSEYRDKMDAARIVAANMKHV